MYYAYEFVNGEWVEIGASTSLIDLIRHLFMVGVDDYEIIGW